MIIRQDKQYFQNGENKLFTKKNYHTHENDQYHTYLKVLLKTVCADFVQSPTTTSSGSFCVGAVQMVLDKISFYA